jgi:SulP family sulfate permease
MICLNTLTTATIQKIVTIDLTHAQIWDASSVAALDAIEYRYQRHGANLTFTGLDNRSSDFRERLSGNLGLRY